MFSFIHTDIRSGNGGLQKKHPSDAPRNWHGKIFYYFEDNTLCLVYGPFMQNK